MSLFLFTKKIIAGEPIDVFNFGKHARDFTFIDDIVEGVVRTLDKVATPNPDWNGAEPDPGTSAAPYRLYNIGNRPTRPIKLATGHASAGRNYVLNAMGVNCEPHSMNSP
jgi:UDP-glucuronate 4-epimerase